MAEQTETDNILADVLAASREVAGEPPETVVEQQPPIESEALAETAEQKADRERDEQGRFKAKTEGETAKEPQKRDPLKIKSETLQKAAEQEIAEKGELKSPDLLAPVEWKGGAKVDWQRLPPEVRKEIRSHWDELNEQRQQIAPIQQAIAPHRDVLVRDAGSVEAGIGQLMTFYQAYLDNPQGLIQHIARTRGIDLGQPGGQPDNKGIQPTSDLNSVVAQAVQHAIAPIQQRFQQTETQQTEQTLSAFAADPKHPYFQDVRAHMGKLLEARTATSLEEAYEQAIWANPTIRQQLMSQQAEETAKARTADAAKANMARAASLRGSPLPGGGSAAATGSSVLDDVRAAAAEVAGA